MLQLIKSVPKDNGREAWKVLCEQYDGQGVSTKFVLLKRLFDIRQAGNKNISSHVVEWTETFRKVKEVGIGWDRPWRHGSHAISDVSQQQVPNLRHELRIA